MYRGLSIRKCNISLCINTHARVVVQLSSFSPFLRRRSLRAFFSKSVRASFRLSSPVTIFTLHPSSFLPSFPYSTTPFSRSSIRTRFFLYSLKTLFLSLSLSLTHTRFALSRAHGRIINKTFATSDVQTRQNSSISVLFVPFLDLNATLVLNAMFHLAPSR